MTKFLITAGFMIGTLLGVLLGLYGFLVIGIKLGEFLDDIERKYGFKGSVIAFIVLMAISSIIGAAILTFMGV